MAAQGAFGTDFYDRSTRMIVGTRLWTEYRPVIKIGPKGALGSHEIRPIHSAPSLGPSIVLQTVDFASFLPNIGLVSSVIVTPASKFQSVNFLFSQLIRGG